MVRGGQILKFFSIYAAKASTLDFFKVKPTDFLIDWMQDLMGHMKDFWTFCPKRKRKPQDRF